jgi:hypothetical protein
MTGAVVSGFSRIASIAVRTDRIRLKADTTMVLDCNAAVSSFSRIPIESAVGPLIQLLD